MNGQRFTAGREAAANVCFTVGSEREQKYQNKTK